jgi:hypothetical protein
VPAFQATDAWNARPNLVFEESDKTFINEMADRGGPIRTMAEMDENAATDAYNSRQGLTRVVASALRREVATATQTPPLCPSLGHTLATR